MGTHTHTITYEHVHARTHIHTHTHRIMREVISLYATQIHTQSQRHIDNTCSNTQRDSNVRVVTKAHSSQNQRYFFKLDFRSLSYKCDLYYFAGLLLLAYNKHIL